MAELQRSDPEAWLLLREVLALWLQQNPTVARIVTDPSKTESDALDLLGRMLDFGLLKLCEDRVGLWFGVWDPICQQYVKAA